MTRLFFFLLGFSLTLIGTMFILCYLNLMNIGYNFKDYGEFIIRRPECLQTIVGIIIIILSIHVRRGGKNELYL